MTSLELTISIKRQQQLIEQNQKQRNQKFQQCMNKFSEHLQKEVKMVEQELTNNDKRNAIYSEAFETTYQRMLVGAEQIISKMKHTLMHKRNFWKKIVEEHEEIKDLDLKAECYEYLKDKEDKYHQAIGCQKVQKIPYKVIVGYRDSNQDLAVQQQKNKELETQIAMTRKNSGDAWVKSSRIRPQATNAAMNIKQDSMLSDQIITKFMKTSNSKMPAMPAMPRPPSAPRPGSASRSQRNDSAVLDEFMRK